jgi:hypothetical protein
MCDEGGVEVAMGSGGGDDVERGEEVGLWFRAVVEGRGAPVESGLVVVSGTELPV